MAALSNLRDTLVQNIGRTTLRRCPFLENAARPVNISVRMSTWKTISSQLGVKKQCLCEQRSVVYCERSKTLRLQSWC